MTEFFPYENLTWPEVNDLPRDTPLVLPLGTGYPLDRLASALGCPDRAGLLPPMPFGWPGSGLQVPSSTLAAYVANLIDSLQDDGFSQVYALTPQGLNWATWCGPASRQVRRIASPFYLICGYGETGGVLVRALTDRHRRAVVTAPG